jgi:hypothetical protein
VFLKFDPGKRTQNCSWCVNAFGMRFMVFLIPSRKYGLFVYLATVLNTKYLHRILLLACFRNESSIKSKLSHNHRLWQRLTVSCDTILVPTVCTEKVRDIYVTSEKCRLKVF